MGRGKQWSNQENRLLALAWVMVSEDPLLGTDRNAEAFMAGVFVRFLKLCPALA